MVIYSSKYHIRETHSVGTSFQELLTGKHLDNPYLIKIFAKLIVLIKELGNSIAFHEQESLAEESDAVDYDFNEAYKKLRTFIETKAALPELGVESEKCQIMSDIINRHNRDLHEFPKDEQIIAWDSVHKEFDSLEEEVNGESRTIMELGGVDVLYTPVVAHHKALKKIEKERAELGTVKREVRSPSDIIKEVKPVIQKIYSHLEDFADLDEPDYLNTVNEIDAKIAPVVTRVKARITKNRNSAE